MYNHFQSYFQKALELITKFNESETFPSYLKKYFAANKKHGSKDRKWIGQFCYSYFRLGHAISTADITLRMKVAIFLCSQDANEKMQELLPETWQLALDLDQKLAVLKTENIAFDIDQLFPLQDKLMPEVALSHFAKSHLTQPKIFIRIRPNKEEIVRQKLTKAGIAFEQISESCLAFEKQANLAEILKINTEVVIQDLNSQQIATLFPDNEAKLIWDCCAASGGKTMLAHDYFPDAKINASDLRNNILINLQSRLKEANINKNVHIFRHDMTEPLDTRQKFDLIIADAPCSGSGTWGRNPENLLRADEEQLSKYSALQFIISKNALRALKSDGYFLYITCSVYTTENTENIEKLCSTQNLEIVRQELFTGYEQRADTLFACLLKKK